MAPAPADLATNHLEPGEQSARVLTWQRMLIHRGFVLTETGIFDKPTTSATHVAQAFVGLPDFSGVGPKTWQLVDALPRRDKPPIKIPPIFRPRVLDCRLGQNGFARHRSKNWGKRPWSGVRGVLGHYTGGPASFQADAQFHVRSNYLSAGGAPAIAYSAGIDYDGTIYVFNDHDDLTWHCDGGQNAVWYGVVFRGAAGGMTLAQRRSMRWLVKKLKSGGLVKGMPALAQKRATTHQHVNSTSCPGVKGEAQYRDVFSQNGYSFWNNPPRP